MRYFCRLIFEVETHMKVTRTDLDALNAVVTIALDKADFQPNVERVLEDYRKRANIPGFRKGHVPKGLIKKQYETAVTADEVNKLLQQSLNDFLTKEKIAILGNPLPKAQDDLDWKADQLAFDFELGLSPDFEVKPKTKKAVIHYKISADTKTIDNQIERIRKQYGKLVALDKAEKGASLSGSFHNEAEGIENKATFELDSIQSKTALKALQAATVGEVVALKTKGLFEDDHKLMHHLGVEHDKAHGLNISVDFTVSEINKTEPADLDKDLFDKLFGPDQIKTVTELKARLKADAEKQFENQADQQLLNDYIERLIEETKFDLPSAFLKRWIQTSGENPLTETEAASEYERSEKGLRYQLIEGQLAEKNNLKVTFEDVKSTAKEMIKAQMLQFGRSNPEDKELEDIAARILQNEDEVKRLSNQVMSEKLLTFFKTEGNIKEKAVTYEAFLKAVQEE